MRIRANWILEQLPWLADKTEEELNNAMVCLGHRADTSGEVWEFIPRTQRPDLHCVTGILREIAAAFGKAAEVPQIRTLDEDIGSVYEQVDVDVWSETICNRLTARMCVGLQVGKTPDWMKEQLLSSGLPCANSVNDIASYAMLEFGQPVFLLDASAIRNGTLTFREAMGFETAETLALPYGAPVLESGDDILAVPHFWTSPSAAVSSSTETLFIAAVNYPEDVISLCDEAFGISSAASLTQDPLLTITAVERVCQLIQEFGYGHILEGTIDILNYVPNPKKLDLNAEYLGDNSLTKEEFSTILSLIGITPDGLVPSWRTDLDSPEAVHNEVLRLHRANTLRKE